MAEKINTEQLIKLPFKDIVVPLLEVIKTVSPFTKFPNIPQGLAINDFKTPILYDQKNFINAFQRSLLFGAQYDQSNGRDGGIVRAGYILDLMHLVKPEFQDQTFDMVYETTKILDREKFLENKDVSKKQNNNNYLAMIFGRAASILWINENYQTVKREPFMNMMDPINFFDNYKKKLRDPEDKKFISTYYSVWLGVLKEVGLLNSNTSLDDLYNVVLQKKLPELIELQKLEKSNAKFIQKIL